MKRHKPLVLIILDGWGLSPTWGGNPIVMNNPPNLTKYWREYPHKVLLSYTHKDGNHVLVGDSRLGLSTIAAGRRVPQNYEIITDAINDRTFFRNRILKDAFIKAKSEGSRVHFVGMISEGAIHSHLDHLLALLEMAHREGVKDVLIHAITDGVDSEPAEALKFVEKIKEKMLRVGVGRFATLAGRSFAMDRHNNWDKTIEYFKLIFEGIGKSASTIESAISSGYKEGYDDASLVPTLISKDGKIKENDIVVFFNFRPDRTAQIMRLICDRNFKRGFWQSKVPEGIQLVSLAKITDSPLVNVVFPDKKITGTLPEVLSRWQFKQLRLAESEKTLHATTFFNCNEPTFYNEVHEIFLSPAAEALAKQPATAVPRISKAAVKAVQSRSYDFILINLSNVDLVSQTGDILATGRAVLETDKYIEQIVEENLDVNGITIITADHGNVEQMINVQSGSDPETCRSYNPVPFILIGREFRKDNTRSAAMASFSNLSKIIGAKAKLEDIAPTILELMGLPKPDEMVGHSLLKHLE